jgi:hypothetical protein
VKEWRKARKDRGDEVSPFEPDPLKDYQGICYDNCPFEAVSTLFVDEYSTAGTSVASTNHVRFHVSSLPMIYRSL